MITAIISLLTCLVLYSIYMVAYFELHEGPQQNKANAIRVASLYILGIIVFGFVPATWFSTPVDVIVFGNQFPTALQVIAVAFLAWLASFISLTQANKTAVNPLPQMHTKVHSMLFIAIRIAFLVSYEIFFRGYLLTELMPFGLDLALLLNIGLYALLHCFSPKNELSACIPFGLLLCALCIWINAAWPAILIHLALGITYESALIFKPQLKPII